MKRSCEVADGAVISVLPLTVFLHGVSTFMQYFALALDTSKYYLKYTFKATHALAILVPVTSLVVIMTEILSDHHKFGLWPNSILNNYRKDHSDGLHIFSNKCARSNASIDAS